MIQQSGDWPEALGFSLISLPEGGWTTHQRSALPSWRGLIFPGIHITELAPFWAPVSGLELEEVGKGMKGSREELERGERWSSEPAVRHARYLDHSRRGTGPGVQEGE